MLWQLRPGNKADESFYYSSWLKSFRDASLVSGISNTVYYSRFHDLIENLLNDPLTAVVVACSPDDPEQIFGYCVATIADTGNVLHWVYIKHPFRKFGIARDMVGKVSPVVHTTKARPSAALGNSVYDPFALLKFYK